MKILITGGSGLLGQFLNLELSKEHNILTLYHSHPGNCGNYDNLRIDISNYNSFVSIFKNFNPDIVVHTAAISNPKSADELPDDFVYTVNVTATRKLAELCSDFSAKLIFTSTDLVYDGLTGKMLDENAKLNPLSLYAYTKLMGEVKIRETFDNFIILRTALMYGFGLNHSINHFMSVYKNLKEGKPVNLFYDQFRSPLALHDAARMISKLIKLDIKGEVINFGGRERVSRFKLGELLCEEIGCSKSFLKKISMDEVNGFYKVKDVSLNVSKLREIGIEPKGIRESIKELLS